jgi:hypothetical protein
LSQTCRNGYTPISATKPQNDATKRTSTSAATQHATALRFVIRVLAAGQLAAPSCAAPTGVAARYFIWQPLPGQSVVRHETAAESIVSRRWDAPASRPQDNGSGNLDCMAPASFAHTHTRSIGLEAHTPTDAFTPQLLKV